jgi:hypothetical protein
MSSFSAFTAGFTGETATGNISFIGESGDRNGSFTIGFWKNSVLTPIGSIQNGVINDFNYTKLISAGWSSDSTANSQASISTNQVYIIILVIMLAILVAGILTAFIIHWRVRIQEHVIEEYEYDFQDIDSERILQQQKFNAEDEGSRALSLLYRLRGDEGKFRSILTG